MIQAADVSALRGGRQQNDAPSSGVLAMECACALIVAMVLFATAVAALWPTDAFAEQSAARAHVLQASRIDSGRYHTCAIDPGGDVRCWGYGGGGQLGHGNTENVGDDETPAEAGVIDLGGHSATAITVGYSFSCVILETGGVKCWGGNNSGSLGYGNTTAIGDDETPAAVGTVDLGIGRTAVAISAGEGHACAILDNGTVRCWGGSNNFGQLGYGNTTPIGDNETPAAAGPVNLGAGRTAVAISTGSADTCALLDNGSVRCWGYNGYGQLGTGNTAHIGDNETPGSIPPIDLGAGRTAVAIASGWSHNCAILDNGSTKCWGNGESGKLGTVGTSNVLSPSSIGPIDLGVGRTAIAVAASDNHTCAALDNGTVRCWGNAQYGKLGYGNLVDIGDNETPGSVGPVDLGTGRRAIAITIGKYFSCAQLDDSDVRCWGEGFFGQLGYGNQTTIGDDESPSLAGPVDLGITHGALETAAGGSHSCALFDNGTVRCWGLNSSGQLGIGSTENIGDNENPGAGGTVDMGGRKAVEIAAGDAHSCALLDDGTVRCWGKGANGQLGYGNTQNVGDNETVGSISTVNFGGESAIGITAGENHSCALMANATVRCWGLNSSGQLGYGNTESIGDNESPSSFTASLGRGAVAIGAGGSHTCARLDDGTVRCWGAGANGQLGYGNTNAIGDNEAPSTAGPVSAGRSVSSVATGKSHTCVRLDDSTLRCWGLGTNGRLGYSNNTTIGDNEAPSTIGTVNVGAGANAVAAGGSHTCSRLYNSMVRCWGLNGNGQLGYGNTSTIGDNETPALAGPVSLGAGRSATDVSAGASHTCAVLDNGTVRCWGLNSSGQLGTGNTATIGDDETPGSLGPLDFEDDMPVAVGDSATMVEDSSATAIDVLANDTDVDGGPKTIVSKTNGSNGTVSITGGGTGLSYAPAPNYCGADSFVYELNGGSKATVSVTVTCVDDLPSAAGDSATVEEDASSTAIAVLANDTDIDGGPKTIASASDPDHGAVVLVGGSPGAHSGLTYVPDANYCGPDSFTYTLNGGSTATVSVTVTCVDDPPVAVNDSASVAEDATATAIDVLGNDTDIDMGPKAIADASDPSHGTVALTGGTAGAHTGLTYAPDPDYCGPDSFTYTLNGGSSATVSVAVGCVDDLPTAVDDSATLAEDSPATVIDVLANDSDVDGGKAITSKTNGSHGAVAIVGGGLGLTYAPSVDYCGPDSFTYELNGGSTATVSVTVSCVDDAPAAMADSSTVAEDSGATSIDVLANDVDPDAGSKEVASKTNGSHGAVAITGGGSGLTYTPDPDYCGSDSFTYTLNGGSTATVSITVTCVDDPPAASNDSLTLAEDSGAAAVDVLANDADSDGGAKQIASKTNGSHGAVAITGGDSGLTYTPAPDYCGPDSFTYTLNGGSTATVSVTVTCVDDLPVAVNDADNVSEDAAAQAIDVLANDTDVDGGPKSIVGKANGAHGAVTVIGGGAGLTYQPAPDYCGPDSFTYTLNGGSTATVSIAVTCVDEPQPPVQNPGNQTPSEGGGSSQTIVQNPPSSGPVVNVTPGVGVVSGRRRPRIAIKGAYAFFTLTCRMPEKDCAGTVTITATVPSVTLGPTMKEVTLVKGKFRIGAGRSVLVRAKLNPKGTAILESKRTLRGVVAHMGIVDAINGERGEIQVNLVRRPKASLLPG